MKRIVYVVICMLASVNIAQAQTECEALLKAAEEYYSRGDYKNAAVEYRLVQECSQNDNYGGAAAKLRECNYYLQEKEAYEKCTTMAACNYYLEKYPSGRYVEQVRKKRTEMIKVSVNAAEDDRRFQNCITEEDYRDYLRNHPYGRHVSQARTMLAQFEEDKAYLNCNTEDGCNAYLKAYPKGRYYSEVTAKLHEFEEERLLQEMKAAETAYMKIKGVDFANTHSTGVIINDYGSTLYVDEIRYLTPRISYEGLMDEVRMISLFCKIISPNGSVMSDENSPVGYTYSHIFNVQAGNNNFYELPSFGSYENGIFDGGIYKFELWFRDSRIYQTYFEIVDKENALSHGYWRTMLDKCCDFVSHRSDNGSVYKGEYKDYRRSGLGLYSWKGLFYYIGQWDYSAKEGLGLEIAPSGSSLSNCPDCVYYVGGYSNDMKSGTGSCYDKYGNLIYYGGFSNDKPTQNYPMTGFDNYKFECIEYSWGDYYVGETRNGKPNGQGMYIWSHGDLWYGKYNDGKRDGNGILMLYQGELSSGIWKGDRQE